MRQRLHDFDGPPDRNPNEPYRTKSMNTLNSRGEYSENTTDQNRKHGNRVNTLNSQALNSALIVGNFITVKYVAYFTKKMARWL